MTERELLGLLYVIGLIAGPFVIVSIFLVVLITYKKPKNENHPITPTNPFDEYLLTRNRPQNPANGKETAKRDHKKIVGKRPNYPFV